MSHPSAAPPSLGERKAFLMGMAACWPFLIVGVPFAVLFGVVATEAGFPLTQTMGFTLAVFAGASQFSAVQLMRDEAPVLIVLATSLAVNLRMGMYSAALTPYFGKLSLGKRALVAFFLVDQSYAAAVIEFEKRPQMTLGERLAFFFGTTAVVAPPWYIATFIGALVGSSIPKEYAIDFAMPITFIAMVAPLLRTIPHLVAAFTSIALTLVLSNMPFASGLLVAAICAMFAGALTETALEKRA